MVVPGLPCKTRAAPARINVELAAGGNTVACVNAALVDFALNWHCHLRRIDLTGMLVMAWDDRAS